MKIQNFYWGRVTWLCELEGSVNIGLSTIKPGAIQKRHIHYGNEQYIYLLKGKGIYSVNDKDFVLSGGQGIYFPPDSSHMTRNLTDEEIIDISVSVPTISRIKLDGQNISIGNAIEKIREDAMLDSLNFPIAIYDINKNLIYSNSSYKNEKLCEIDKELRFDLENKNLTISNAKERIIFLKNIGKQINRGQIRTGYLKFSKNYDDDQIFKGSIESIKKITEELARAIDEYMSFHDTSKKLKYLNRELSRKQSNLENLNKALYLKKEELLDYRVNKKLVINALNVISHEAIKYDIDLYNMVGKLSAIIHNSYEKRRDFETVLMQLDMVNNMIDFESIRYFKNLSVFKNIDKDILNVKLPANILSPLVQNAFDHGFENYMGEKILYINIYKKDKLILEVKNTGKIPDMSSLYRINKEIDKSFTSLNLIKNKLEKFYTNFKFYYKTDSNMTIARIEI